MEPHIFTDVAGRAWEVIDYRIEPRPGQRPVKRRVPLGDWKAEGRAFVPVGREGPVLLHHFGYTAYREPTPKTLNSQLDSAKPATATPAERMQRNQ